MLSNSTNCWSRLLYSNTLKRCCRTFCSKKEDATPTHQAETNNETDNAEDPSEFIETQIPAHKYNITNKKKTLLEALRDDFKHTIKYLKNPNVEQWNKPFIPYHVDILVVGAGPVGTTIAQQLKDKLKKEVKILVVDSDLSPEKFMKNDPEHLIMPQMTLGYISQQFSLKENILLSKFSSNYFRQMGVLQTTPEDNSAQLQFKPFGHLTLATNKGHIMLKENHIQQSKYGVFTELNTSYQLSQRFPWMNVEDISLGSIGTMNEGWIDPWQYMLTVRSSAMSKDVSFAEGKILEFHFKETDLQVIGYNFGEYLNPHSIILEEKNGNLREIDFGIAIIALGSETGQFMKEMFNLDSRNRSMFALEVPITRKKHYVFCFESEQAAIGYASPLVNDPSGVYFKREGLTNFYICGCTLPMEDENADNLTVDPKIFYEYVWPILAHRVPAFEKLQLKSGWAYFEDHNRFDGSPLLGFHPAFINIIVAAGFGKNSFLYAPAIANSMTEYLFHSYYDTLDLTRFGYNRIAQDEPLVEPLII